MSLAEPKSYREADVTYFVGPFTFQESHFVETYLRPVRYEWTHKPTGRTGKHTVYVFPEDVQRFSRLVNHWNRMQDWEYGV